MKTGYSFGSLASFVEQINSTTVKLTGDQTIAGSKTFSSNPISSAAQGSGGAYLTRRDFVENLLSYKAPTDSPAFTGNPTAPTAAIFDADTTIATTAFVQRALGNRQSFVWYNGGDTLQAAHVGCLIMLGNSGTYYLPNLNHVPVGAQYQCYCQGGGYIAAQAGQTLVYEVNHGGDASILISAGDTFTVTKATDGYWFYEGTNYTPTAPTSEYSTRPASTAFVKNYLNSSPALAGTIRLTGSLEVTDRLNVNHWFFVDGAATRDNWDTSINGNVAVDGAISCDAWDMPNHETFFPMISNTTTTKNYGFTFRAKFGTYGTGNAGWGEKQAAIWVGSGENTTHPHYVFKFSAYGDFTANKLYAASYDISGDTMTRGSSNTLGNATVNGTVYTNHIVSNYDIITGTQPIGTNNTYVATTAFVQNELSRSMSAVSYAQSNGETRWFKIGWLPASADDTLDTFHAFGAFGAWAGAKHAFSLTATNRSGLKVNCESDIQMPFYFFQLAGGEVEIFALLGPWQIMAGQTWITPAGQGGAYRMGEVPDVYPTGTQVATTQGSTKRYAYLTSPSFDGTVSMAGALNVNGTTTTNGLIVTSGTDFRSGIAISGGDLAVSNGSVVAAGTITSGQTIGFRMINGDYGSFDYQDRATRYILVTNKGDQWGGFNGLRPFALDLASGKITMCNSVVIQNGLRVEGGATLTGVSTAPTCGVSTNDTQIATTEFVQRAKGGLRGVLSLSNNTVIGSSQAGSLISYVSGYTVTLNASSVSGLTAGDKFMFAGSPAGSWTLAISGVTVSDVYGDTYTTLDIHRGYTEIVYLGGNSFLLTNLTFRVVCYQDTIGSATASATFPRGTKVVTITVKDGGIWATTTINIEDLVDYQGSNYQLNIDYGEGADFTIKYTYVASTRVFTSTALGRGKITRIVASR